MDTKKPSIYNGLISRLGEFPTGTEFWIVLQDEQIHHDADQRSKDCPGHGYPAYSDDMVKLVRVFTNEADFIEFFQAEHGKIFGKKMRAFHIDKEYVTEQVVKVKIVTK